MKHAFYSIMAYICLIYAISFPEQSFADGSDSHEYLQQLLTASQSMQKATPEQLREVLYKLPRPDHSRKITTAEADHKRRMFVQILLNVAEHADSSVASTKPIGPIWLNIMPPAGSDIMVAGISPESITDPELRKEYEARIEESNQNARASITLGKYEKIRDMSVSGLVMFFEQTAIHAPDELEDYADLVNETISNEEIRRQIFGDALMSK